MLCTSPKVYLFLAVQEEWLAAKKREAASKGAKKDKGKAADTKRATQQKAAPKAKPGKAGETSPKAKKPADPVVGCLCLPVPKIASDSPKSFLLEVEVYALLLQHVCYF